MTKYLSFKTYIDKILLVSKVTYTFETDNKSDNINLFCRMNIISVALWACSIIFQH